MTGISVSWGDLPFGSFQEQLYLEATNPNTEYDIVAFVDAWGTNIYDFLHPLNDFVEDAGIDWSLLSLNNYALAFNDSRFINSLQVTFWFTVISVGLSVIIGLFIAVIVQKGGRLHTLTKVLLIFPFAVSPALKGYSWRFMLNEEYGIYDLLIDQLIVTPLNALLSLINALPIIEIPLISESIVWLGDKFWALFHAGDERDLGLGAFDRADVRRRARLD